MRNYNYALYIYYWFIEKSMRTEQPFPHDQAPHRVCFNHNPKIPVHESYLEDIVKLYF
jgi:hypothetical protein